MRTKRSKRRQAHRERERQPPWFEKLRVMADYGSSGIWAMQQIGVFRHGMLEHGDLRLPQELSQRFTRWIALYEQRLEEPAQFDHETFNTEGRALAQALKHYVGSTTYVEFQ